MARQMCTIPTRMANTIVPSKPKISLGTMHFFTPSGIQLHSSISIEKKVWNSKPITVVAMPNTMPKDADFKSALLRNAKLGVIYELDSEFFEYPISDLPKKIKEQILKNPKYKTLFAKQ